MSLSRRSSRAVASSSSYRGILPRGEHNAIDIEAEAGPANLITSTSYRGGRETVVRRPVLTNILIKLVTLCIAILTFPFVPIYSVSVFIARGLNGSVQYRARLGVCYKLQPFKKIHIITKIEGFFIPFILTILGMVLLLFPRLEEVTLFGSYLTDWFFLAGLMICGHPFIYVVFIWFGELENFVGSRKRVQFHQGRHDAYYWGILTANLTLLLSYAWHLFVWLFFLNSDPLPGGYDLVVWGRGITMVFTDEYNIITWSLVSLLLAASLLLVKKMLLLRWDAKYIYNRFRARILMAGFQLYFLSLIIDGSSFHHLKPFNVCWQHNAGSATVISRRNNISRFFERSPIQQCILSKYQYCLSQISTIVGFLKQASLSEFDILSEIQQKCQPNIQGNNNRRSEEYLTQEALQQQMGIISVEEAGLLLKQLQAEFASTHVKYEDFRKWLVDAHEDCLSLGCTLVNASKVSGILNKFLTWILLLLVSIFWLLGVAPFRGFVRKLLKLKTPLIATVVVVPLIAYLTRHLIQGLYFLFIVHPINIGDLCTIQDEEVEITEMDTFKTTCKKIDTGEEMTYQNSALLTTLNAKLFEGERNLADDIEFVLGASYSKDHIVNLQKKIEDFLNRDPRVFENSSSVMPTEIEESKTKMNVRFHHTMNLRDYLNPLKSFQIKETQRSQLLLEIKGIIEVADIAVAAP